MISKCTNPFEMLVGLSKCSDYLLKCSNRHQNVRNPHRKRRQCSKHTTGSRNAQTLSKCPSCLQKRPKSTRKEQRMFKTHDRTPQCSRKHSIASFEPFTGQNTFGIESKYQQLYTVDYLGMSTTGSQSRF